MFFAWVMSLFESKSVEAFWVLSQFDFIPREDTQAMSQSYSIPGESAWVLSWIWVNSVENCLSHGLNRFNSPRYYLRHELIRINFSGSLLHLKPKRVHTKSNGMGRILKAAISWEDTWVESPKRLYHAKSIGTNFKSKLAYQRVQICHELIRINILESFCE